MLETAPRSRPYVIAHRGASGYLPEHTLAAKTLAFAHGADFLEQDLVASRDDELIVVHDIHLDRISDVAARYPGRDRDDGRYYVRDFTLAELRTLRATERLDESGTAPVYPQRFPPGSGAFELHTMREELEFVAGLARSTDRLVGIYPEIKRPAWHHAEGVDVGRLLLETLNDFGFRHRTDPVFVQCFDFDELKRWRGEFDSDLALVQLVGENSWGESPTDFDWLRSEAGLSAAAEIVDALGPWIPQLRATSAAPGGNAVADWVRVAQRLNLGLHPYTLRRDDLPPGFDNARECLHWLVFDVGITGLFSDFPDQVVDFLAEFSFDWQR